MNPEDRHCNHCYSTGFKEGVLVPSGEAKKAERQRIISFLKAAQLTGDLDNLIARINLDD